MIDINLEDNMNGGNVLYIKKATCPHSNMTCPDTNMSCLDSMSIHVQVGAE